jgi:hypothetical protein
MKKGLLTFLDNLTPFKITRWSESSENGGMDEREPADMFDGANVVSSRRTDITTGVERHAVLLDLDVPAWLIPSSTEGHSHLYIDVKCGRSAYFRLLDALAECNVIERGYADVSKRKGGTFLRLPWVKKEKPMGFAPVLPVQKDPWF